MRGIIDRLGAVHLPLVAAAVLTLSLASASAQVVEQPQTWDNLNEQWPCNNGLTNRIARVMDADSTSDIGGGGGSTQVWVQCDGVDTWSIVNIGGGAGGSGDVVGPSSSTDNALARFDSTTGKLLQNSTVFVTDGASPFLQLGGTTSSFPALKRNAGNIDVRLADDSAYGGIQGVSLFNVYDGAARAIVLYPTAPFKVVGLASDIPFGWSSGTDGGTLDTSLTRKAAAVVGINGALSLDDAGSKPSCDSSHRFWLWPEAGGAGVADTFSMCMKDAADSYAWVVFSFAP